MKRSISLGGITIRLTVLLAMAGLVAFPAGCGRDSADVYAPEDELAGEVFGTREALNQQMEEVLRQSRISLDRARSHSAEAKPLPLRDLPHATDPQPVTIRAEVPPPVCERLAVFDEPPLAFAVTNEGYPVYSFDEGTYLLTGEEEPVQLLPFGATHLQFDRGGRILLAQGGDSVLLLSGEQFGERRRLDNTPPGKALWGPDEGSSLLFLREAVLFDASQRERVFLDLQRYNIESASASAAGWSPFRRYSAMGTLPALGIVWAQRIQPYQILPIPGEIVEIDNGEPVRLLTAPEQAIDLYPTASSDGKLVWLRTWQRRGEGSARVYAKERLERDAPELQITSRPSLAAGISPNGDWIAYVASNPEGAEIRRLSAVSIQEERAVFAAYAQADAEVRRRSARLEESLRNAFEELEIAGALSEEEQGRRLHEVPDMGDFEQMADAFRRAARESFGVDISTGLAGLSEADALLDEIAPYMEEAPWTIVALAGFLAEALPEDRHWYLPANALALGQDVVDVTESDGLSFTAVNMPGAARERLGGELSLRETADRLWQAEQWPLYLVENLRQETMEELRLEELTRAGGLHEETTIGELYRRLISGPVNDAVHRLAIELGQEGNHAGLFLVAAYRLAAANPHSGEALTLFGNALKDGYLLEEARQVLEQAVRIDPQDPYAHFDLADVYLLLDRLSDARAEYESAREHDETEELLRSISGRLGILDELEEEQRR